MRSTPDPKPPHLARGTFGQRIISGTSAVSAYSAPNRSSVVLRAKLSGLRVIQATDQIADCRRGEVPLQCGAPVMVTGTVTGSGDLGIYNVG